MAVSGHAEKRLTVNGLVSQEFSWLTRFER